MKRCAVLVTTVACILAVGMIVPYAYASGHEGSSKGHLDLEKKFYGKIEMIYKNEDELGLSDEQMSKIKAIKIETKKELIKKNAEIDLVALDMKAMMWVDEMDTAAIGKLIDTKYDIKKEKAKTLINACASLKKILTNGQQEKMKELKKQSAKEMRESSGMYKKCRMMSGN